MKNSIISNALRRVMAVMLLLVMTAGLVGTKTADEAEAATVILSDGIYAFGAYNNYRQVVNVLFRKTNGYLGLDNLNWEDNELFVVRNVGSGYVTLSPVFDTSSYIVGGLFDAQLKISRTTSSDRNAQWKPTINSDSSVTLVNRKSGLALDNANGKTDTGNRIVSYSKNGYSAAQSFWAIRFSESTSTLTPGSSAGIASGTLVSIRLSLDSRKCINDQYASTVSDSAKLVVDVYNGESNELFYIYNRGNNRYSIHPKNAPSLALNVPYGESRYSYQIQFHTYEDGDTASLWEIYYNSDSNTYCFRNVMSGLYLDTSSADTSVGNRMVSYPYNGTAAQKFYIISESGSGVSTISGRLDEMMNGTYDNGTFKVGTKYTGTYAQYQCKGFAMHIFLNIFKCNIGTTKSNDYQINYSSTYVTEVGSKYSISASDASDMLRKAMPGDFIQVKRRKSQKPHSMIVVSVDNNGVTVLQANVDNNNGITKSYYSWTKFATDNIAVSLYHAKEYYLH